MYTVEGSSTASFHMRSSPETAALSRFGGVKKVSPRFLERVAVTPGTSARLVNARFGMAELFGSGAFTAMSASPPPGATPRLGGLPTVWAHPAPVWLGHRCSFAGSGLEVCATLRSAVAVQINEANSAHRNGLSGHDARGLHMGVSSVKAPRTAL